MEKRSAGGLIVFILGIVILLVGVFTEGQGRIIWVIYGTPLVVFGLIILLNKNEDKIEKINYKGGKNNGKK